MADIGINAMSSIDAMRKDFIRTIRRLREGGCGWIEAMSDWGASRETVEFYAEMSGGPSGWDRENTVRRIQEMKKYGLRVEGLFVFYEHLEEQAEDLGKYCLENGISYVVVSFLEYGDIDDIYGKIALIRNVSEKLRLFHVQILIHNHEQDSRIVRDRDGSERRILDIILRELEPEELMLEVDTGWLVYAGVDAVSYVRENRERIAALHLKDLCRGYEKVQRDSIFVPCGQGVVDFPGIFKEVSSGPPVRLILDQDSSQGDIIKDHLASMRYLRSMI